MLCVKFWLLNWLYSTLITFRTRDMFDYRGWNKHKKLICKNIGRDLPVSIKFEVCIRREWDISIFVALPFHSISASLHLMQTSVHDCIIILSVDNVKTFGIDPLCLQPLQIIYFKKIKIVWTSDNRCFYNSIKADFSEYPLKLHINWIKRDKQTNLFYFFKNYIKRLLLTKTKTEIATNSKLYEINFFRNE